MKPLFLLVSLAFAAPVWAQTAPLPATAVQDIAAKVRPSLVRIHVVESSAQSGRETRQESFGSGVIISPDGYIVTNHHVAGKARWLSCTLFDKREVEAKLIGTDPLSDLAVIKIAGGPYQSADWGDDTKLRVGDPVLAMGSPLAFSQSVTAGIVSNTELVMPDTYAGTLSMDGEDVGSIVRWIGHDAAIYGGNSGGPLVNLRGEVVGINEIEMGLSGAIPASLARKVAEQLIKNGRVERAFTGLELQPRLRNSGHKEGVLVAGVLPNSPAQKAGIKPGDLILSAKTPTGEMRFDAAFAEALPPVNGQFAGFPIDQTVQLEIQRATQKLQLPITPTARPRALADDIEIAGWDLTGSNITAMMALDYQLPSTKGVLILGVAEGGGGATAQPALEEGDVILSVNRAPIGDLKDLKTLTEKIPRTAQGTPVLVEVWRANEKILSVAKIRATGQDVGGIELAKAWLPVSTQVLTRPLAEALKLPTSTSGVRVTRILGTTGGLQIGDILTKLDGETIEAQSPEDTDVFDDMIRQYPIGSTVKINLLRDNKPRVATVKLAAAPRAERELPTYRDTNFGFTIRAISYWDTMRGDALPNQSGVIVTDVASGGWGSVAGLEIGDVIREIDGTPIKTLEEAKTRLAAIEKARPARAVFFVSSGVHTIYLEAKTGWDGAK